MNTPVGDVTKFPHKAHPHHMKFHPMPPLSPDDSSIRFHKQSTVHSYNGVKLSPPTPYHLVSCKITLFFLVSLHYADATAGPKTLIKMAEPIGGF